VSGLKPSSDSSGAGGGQLQAGPIVAAAGGLILLVSLFLDWYEPSTSGWTAFEALDLLLAALGLATIAGVAVRLGAPLPEGARGLLGDGATAIIGIAALLVVVSQVANHPPAAVDRGADVGQWLALGGTGLMLAGYALGSVRFSIAVDVDQRRPPSRGSDAPTQQLDPLG
jgi:hypothetical protein